jgi:hypothetical protein
MRGRLMLAPSKRFTSRLEGEAGHQRVRPEVTGPMTSSVVGRGLKYAGRIALTVDLPPSLTLPLERGGQMLFIHRNHSHISLG